MYSMKEKLLNEILEHLSKSQGMDLKGLMDEERMPKKNPLASGEDMAMEDDMMPDGKPKGISVEKVSLMAKPKDPMMKDPMEATSDESMDDAMKAEAMPGEEEMSDDELEELLRKALS